MEWGADKLSAESTCQNLNEYSNFFCNPFLIKQRTFQHPIAVVPLVDSPFDCRLFSRERNVNAKKIMHVREIKMFCFQ